MSVLQRYFTPCWFYQVLASTNVSLPLSQWTRVATNNFDGLGDFILIRALEPGLPRRSYLLQVQ